MATVGPTPITVHTQDARGQTASFRAYILGADGQRRSVNPESLDGLSHHIEAFINYLLNEENTEINQALNAPDKLIRFQERNISIIRPGDTCQEITNITQHVSAGILGVNSEFLGDVVNDIYYAGMPGLEDPDDFGDSSHSESEYEGFHGLPLHQREVNRRVKDGRDSPFPVEARLGTVEPAHRRIGQLESGDEEYLEFGIPQTEDALLGVAHHFLADNPV